MSGSRLGVATLFLTGNPCKIKLADKGGINIHRLYFAKNNGEILPLLPTLRVTCDRSTPRILSVSSISLGT
jgi:hypothetical protein